MTLHNPLEDVANNPLWKLKRVKMPTLWSVRTLAVAVNTVKKELLEEEERHKSNLARLNKRLAELQKDCPHPVWQRFPGLGYDSDDHGIKICELCDLHEDL